MAFSPSTTRARARQDLAERFRAAALDDPQREAALLVAAACGARLVALIAEPDAPLDAAAAKLEAFAKRRESGEPLSRILGRREFWSLELAISPDVLDPRPDTETIVEAARRALRERRGEPLRILDLGVGSGALLCALLSELPAARGIGVDLSEAAARIARANVEALGLAARAQVQVGEWTAGLDGPFDLIVSNPPYIPTADLAGLAREVRDHDPRLALDGGADGLDAYRALAPEIARLLAPEGWFFLEVGVDQADAVKTIAVDAGLADVTTYRDLAGIERVVAGRAPRSIAKNS
ncbi:MAG: peptide chain release factor N(5)-glutamine methyltransferase [Hyphomicrobiales bacterium]|nr:peptide chain release factor N(5)-glutamine methyltransferase [Hyphomicrobiales bacterium]MBV8661992.1 peptide chain release factor N(5)-glutamine methyltransferase [Hyphomicrobiales bacterium]